MKLCQHLGQYLSKSINLFIEDCLELIEKNSNTLTQKISFIESLQEEFLSINGQLKSLLSRIDDLSYTIHFQQTYVKQDLQL